MCLQPVNIERYGEHCPLRNVNEMAALEVTGVHTSMLKHDLPPVIVEREHRNCVLRVVAPGRTCLEEHGLTAWQSVRPTMGDLARIKLSKLDDLSALGRNLG